MRRNALILTFCALPMANACGDSPEAPAVENETVERAPGPRLPLCAVDNRPGAAASRPCRLGPHHYGPEQQFSGTMSVGFEDLTFLPTAEGAPQSPEDPVSLSFSETALEECLVRIGAGRTRSLRFVVDLIGRPGTGSLMEGSGYGHLGNYRREILVTRIISQHPCD